MTSELKAIVFQLKDSGTAPFLSNYLFFRWKDVIIFKEIFGEFVARKLRVKINLHKSGNKYLLIMYRIFREINNEKCVKLCPKYDFFFLKKVN